MMSWFGPKLEPGDTIVLCLPRPARVNRLWVGAMAFAPLIGMTAAYLTGLGDFGSREHRITTGFYIGVGMLLLGISAIPAMNFRWRVVVTDRRMVARTGWLRRGRIEMSRNGIDAVKRDTVNQNLVFQTGGRQVAVPFPNHDEEDQVLAALNLVNEAAS